MEYLIDFSRREIILKDFAPTNAEFIALVSEALAHPSHMGLNVDWTGELENASDSDRAEYRQLIEKIIRLYTTPEITH